MQQQSSTPNSPARQRAAALLAAAEAALNNNDRAGAYQFTRQAILTDPQLPHAWVVMSTLVDDPAQQRECLERALAIDPTNEAAQRELHYLEVRRMLSGLSLLTDTKPAEPARKLGVALVEQGLISNRQLEAALAEQRARLKSGQRLPLGEVLLQLRVIEPRALARVLAQQAQQNAAVACQRLGEYLVSAGAVSPTQLEEALDEQLRLRSQGKNLAIGEILVRKGHLRRATLTEILERQRIEFFSALNH